MTKSVDNPIKLSGQKGPTTITKIIFDTVLKVGFGPCLTVKNRLKLHTLIRPYITGKCDTCPKKEEIQEIDTSNIHKVIHILKIVANF